MPNQHRYRLIGFRPPDDLRESLERIAQDQGRPLSDIVMRACREYVDHYPGMESVESDED